MGLFINTSDHHDVYKNEQPLYETNQLFSRNDYLSELMIEQQKANATLKQAVADLGVAYLNQEESQVSKWNHVDDQLNILRKSNLLQKDFENSVIMCLHTINEKNTEIQTLFNEFKIETAEKMTKQEELHGGVLLRLDNQEALIEKISRQLNHIRSILFERTNYLATKIDDGYKITSSYVYKLMTGSDQPLTFFLMNQKEEENQKLAE